MNTVKSTDNSSVVISPISNTSQIVLSANNNALGTTANFSNILTTSGNNNIAIGNHNIPTISSSYNTIVGNYNCELTTYGATNTCFGYKNMETNIWGSNNVCIGSNHLPLATSNFNNCIGLYGFNQLTTGSFNAGIGYTFGQNNVGGSYNLCLGAFTGFDTASSYNYTTCIGYNAVASASNQIVLGCAINNVICPNTLNVAGHTSLVSSSDKVTISTFSTTPSFSLLTGMVYYINTLSTTVTTVSFTDIPTTASQTYQFTFVILPTTANSSYYIKPNTSYISVTSGGNVYSVPLYGISNVVFNSTFTYIMEHIDIVNISTTSTPSFISFISIASY